MASAKLRVAFIGAGALASRYHYPSVAGLSDVEIVGIAELDAQRARTAAETYGVARTFADYKEMLAEVDPEVVYVIMPPQYLFDPVAFTLGQRRHVFVEKPLGMTTDQAKHLAYVAETHGCTTQVGFQRRFIPAMTALKSRVEERGPIHTVSVSFLKHTPDFGKPASQYDGAIDPLRCDGIHAVDTLRWLAGGEVERVSSNTSVRYVPGAMANAVTAHVTFSTGAVGLLHFSYVTGRRIFRAELHGRNATAYVDADRDSYFVADGREPEVYESRAFGLEAGGQNAQEHHWLGFWHEHRSFIDCIRERRRPSCDFQDAVKTMELVDRLYQNR
jgi:virulence factor